MINGAHVILYSTEPHADRAFLRDVLGLIGVDAGDGWLIFALPPAEIAVHPSDRNDIHEFYLMTDDVQALVQLMVDKGFACTEPQDLGWGVLTHFTLPGGGRLGAYEPRHDSPLAGKPGG